MGLKDGECNVEGGGNDVFGGLVPLVGSPVGVEIELGGKPADEMLLGGGMELGGGGGGMATSSSSTDLHLGFRLLSSSQTYGNHGILQYCSGFHYAHSNR